MPSKGADDPTSDATSLLAHAAELVEIVKTAERNRKSLAGDNFYAHKFHNAVVRTTSIATRFFKTLEGVTDKAEAIAAPREYIDTLCSTSQRKATKVAALKRLRLLVETEIRPILAGLSASPVPTTEQVLPLKVLEKTRGYFEKVITQANGCYEHQWYDACSVMIRRFVETLIVELYEAKGRAKDIQDNSGDFLMLQKLIETTMKDTAWNLSRETKRTLPLVKKIGDRAAHNRRYIATKADVDEIIPGLRVVADDLLHLAGIK